MVNLVEYTLSIEDDDMITFKKFIKEKDRESLLVIIDEEISLHKNKTWEVVSLFKRKTTIGCKWMYKIKKNINKSDNIRYKDRLVA